MYGLVVLRTKTLTERHVRCRYVLLLPASAKNFVEATQHGSIAGKLRILRLQSQSVYLFYYMWRIPAPGRLLGGAMRICAAGVALPPLPHLPSRDRTRTVSTSIPLERRKTRSTVPRL